MFAGCLCPETVRTIRDTCLEGQEPKRLVTCLGTFPVPKGQISPRFQPGDSARRRIKSPEGTLPISERLPVIERHNMAYDPKYVFDTDVG